MIPGFAETLTNGTKFQTHQLADIPFARTFEEQGYVLDVANYLLNIPANTPDGQFNSIDDIPCFLPNPITRWYMFVEKDDWEEDRQFEQRWRYPCSTASITGAGYVEKQKPNGIAVSWGWVGIYDLAHSQRVKVFWSTTAGVESIELSPLLGCPTAPITAYFKGYFDRSDQRVRRLMNNLWFKEQFKLNIGTWVMVAEKGLRFSREGDPRLTQSGSYGIITPLYGMSNSLGVHRVVQLFHGTPNMDLAKVVMAIERAKEVNWGPIKAALRHPFLWYDFNTGEVQPLPLEREREYCFSKSDMKWWRTRIFPEVTFEYDPAMRRVSYEEIQKRVEEVEYELGLRVDEEMEPPQVDVIDETPDNTSDVDPEVRDMVENNTDGWYDRMTEVVGGTFHRAKVDIPLDPLQFFELLKDRLNSQGDVDDLKEKLRLSELAVGDNGKEIAKLKKEKADLEAKLSSNEKEITRLTTELGETRADNSRLVAENARIKKHSNETTTKLTENQRDVEVLRNTISGMFEQIMTLAGNTARQVETRNQETPNESGQTPTETRTVTATETRTQTQTHTPEISTRMQTQTQTETRTTTTPLNRQSQNTPNRQSLSQTPGNVPQLQSNIPRPNNNNGANNS